MQLACTCILIMAACHLTQGLSCAFNENGPTHGAPAGWRCDATWRWRAFWHLSVVALKTGWLSAKCTCSLLAICNGMGRAIVQINHFCPEIFTVRCSICHSVQSRACRGQNITWHAIITDLFSEIRAESDSHKLNAQASTSFLQHLKALPVMLRLSRCFK